MDLEALIDAAMLDAKDWDALEEDFAKIAAMIKRAAGAIKGSASGIPDTAWLVAVPEKDDKLETDADVVKVCHDVVRRDEDSLTVRTTVPRVVQ